MAEKKKHKHKQCIMCMVCRPIDYFPHGGGVCQSCCDHPKTMPPVGNTSCPASSGGSGTSTYAGLSSGMGQ